MALWVKMPATKSDNLRLISSPDPHGGEVTPKSWPLTSTCMLTYTYTERQTDSPTYTHTLH